MMRRTSSTLRRLILLIALTSVASACGDSGSTTGPAEEPAGGADSTDASGTVQEDRAEVVITHKYGTTNVPADPQRVVSVGYSDQDDLLALGVVPVGIRDWYGDQPSAVWPWAQPALGSAEPTVLPSSELNIEQIAALRPDLIIGVSSGMTEAEYGLLSSIAPTVAQSGDYPDYGMPWQERTRMLGATFDMVDLADSLIDGIDARFAEARIAHPEFVGSTAAVAFVFDNQPGAYASADVRARLMGDLGFTTPAEFDELAGDSFFASFSPERIDLLETDVVVWLAGEQEAEEAIIGSPLREGLASAGEGREVFVGQELGGAFSFASPLSLGFLLDELVPELALALDGDPATAVPSAVAVGAAEAGEDQSAGPADADAAQAADAWEQVFDSEVSFTDKAVLLDATAGQIAALATVHEGYLETAAAFGGISVEASAEIEGDSAAIDYSILFDDTPTYSDLAGHLERIDDGWRVSAESFCDFMASARVTCDI